MGAARAIIGTGIDVWPHLTVRAIDSVADPAEGGRALAGDHVGCS